MQAQWIRAFGTAEEKERKERMGNATQQLTSRLSSDFLVIVVLGSDITLCLGGIIPIMPISSDPCRERPLPGSSMPLHQHGMRS